MKVEIYLSSRNDAYNAIATYEDGTITVKKGGHIQMDFADHIRGGKTAKGYREDNTYVNQEGLILKDCVFTSASTAAQFVTGRSTNGLVAWKVEKRKSLKDYLAEFE